MEPMTTTTEPVWLCPPRQLRGIAYQVCAFAEIGHPRAEGLLDALVILAGGDVCAISGVGILEDLGPVGDDHHKWVDNLIARVAAVSANDPDPTARLVLPWENPGTDVAW